MATAPETTPPTPAKPSGPSPAGVGSRPHDAWAGVLSYLVPGLGQIIQGRVGKGLLFLVCIYTLFFYGHYLGSGEVVFGDNTYKVSSNVYLPALAPPAGPLGLNTLLSNLYNRPQFVGQFFVGIAAWPALWQYYNYDRNFDRVVGSMPSQAEELPAGPVQAGLREQADRIEKWHLDGDRLVGKWMRQPTDQDLNVIHNAGDKRLDLAWVYTVIAGVLNILVIYDAVAGPALAGQGKDKDKDKSEPSLPLGSEAKA